MSHHRYHIKGAFEVLENLKGIGAMVRVSDGSMKKFGSLDKVFTYLK